MEEKNEKGQNTVPQTLKDVWNTPQFEALDIEATENGAVGHPSADALYYS